MNRSEFYTAIHKETTLFSLAQVKIWQRQQFGTDRYDRMDLHQLERFLQFLKEQK